MGKINKEELKELFKEASWLYTITKNEAIAHIRKKNNSVDLESIAESTNYVGYGMLSMSAILFAASTFFLIICVRRKFK